MEDTAKLRLIKGHLVSANFRLITSKKQKKNKKR